MEQPLEHDPGHVRTREHYEAMVRELQQESAAPEGGGIDDQLAALGFGAAPTREQFKAVVQGLNEAAKVLGAQQDRILLCLKLGTLSRKARFPL